MRFVGLSRFINGVREASATQNVEPGFLYLVAVIVPPLRLVRFRLEPRGTISRLAFCAIN